MRNDILKGAVVGAISAVLVLSAATALAGTGINAVFNLGKTNTVNQTSHLKGSTSSRVLWLTNNGTGPALGLNVQPGAAPFTTNSSVKVSNLNADKLDGLDSTNLNADTLDGLDSTNLNADTLDGLDSTNLNADTLDGLDSTNLIQGTGKILSGRLFEPLDSGNSAILAVPGFGSIEGSSGNGGIPNYRLFWRNLSGTNADVWCSNGSTTTYSSPAQNSGTYVGPLDTANDAIWTIRVGYPGRTATIIVSAHTSVTGTVFYAQAIAQ